MKRPLLLAALLAATPLALQSAAKADPLGMFNIQTPSAGVVNFSGTGTANFNQSLGTNNSFNVGSSTNLGVNASASSTEDYDSSGSAELNLAGTSRLQQTIGTATSAFNQQTTAESSSLAAATAAESKANSSTYGSEWSQEWSASHATDQGWEYKAAGEASAEAGITASAGDADYSAAGYYDASATYGAEGSYQTEETWEAGSKQAWTSGWENTYDQAFTTAYETAVSAASATTELAGNTGIITGDFNTTNTGSSSADLASLTGSFAAGAKASADAAYGSTYDSGSDQYSSESEYDAAWEASYQTAYSAAYSNANASISNTSDSVVTVTGIGVIADVNASNTSSFKASSDLITDAPRDGNGNGNASAGSNLATSSYANQSNSTTANAFMQAFSGGGMGQTAVTGVAEVYNDLGTVGDANYTADTSDDVLRGYNVTTTATQVVESTTAFGSNGTDDGLDDEL